MTQCLQHSILLLALAHHAVAAQAAPAPTKVVGIQGAWWILDDQGELRSFDGRRAVVQRLGGPVRDIARLPNGDLLTLIAPRKASRAIVIEHLPSGGWREFANLVIDAGDPVIGLAVRDSTVAIVTSHAIYCLRADGTRRRQPIRGLTIPEGLQPAIALTASGQLYVGENAGEFGANRFQSFRVELALPTAKQFLDCSCWQRTSTGGSQSVVRRRSSARVVRYQRQPAQLRMRTLSRRGKMPRV